MVSRLPNEKAIKRFESYCSKEKTAGGCIEWIGYITYKGYGSFTLYRVSQTAHRVAWMIAHGSFIPAGMVVMHSCDNRRCVNPGHLSIGTMRENAQDMVRKGRASTGPERGVYVGENSARAKLKEADVLAIREARAEGVSLAALGRMYHVTGGNIAAIVRRKSWRHI